MKVERLTTRSFWSGYFLALCIVSLVQDYRGKEGMLERIEHHWVDAKWSVPIALFVAFWAVSAYVRASVQARETDER